MSSGTTTDTKRTAGDATRPAALDGAVRSLDEGRDEPGKMAQTRLSRILPGRSCAGQLVYCDFSPGKNMRSAYPSEGTENMEAERKVPALPAPEEHIRLLVDSDVANEIDDLYAIALALATPKRFDIRGFVATHFAVSGGPESTEQSFQLLLQVLREAGRAGLHAVRRGGHPMQYSRTPSASDGADLIVEQALAASPEDPLWVVVLGAATNTASAILRAPEIVSRLRVVFHARCSRLWPERTAQFNVIGDIIAVQTLLASDVPLVWFDTGTKLVIPYEQTEQRLAPLCRLGDFLHSYRDRSPHFSSPEKGFFDMGDIAWMIDSTLCSQEVVPAPKLARHLQFDHGNSHGSMLRVTNIDVPGTWELFFRRLSAAHSSGTIA